MKAFQEKLYELLTCQIIFQPFKEVKETFFLNKNERRIKGDVKELKRILKKISCIDR